MDGGCRNIHWMLVWIDQSDLAGSDHSVFRLIASSDEDPNTEQEAKQRRSVLGLMWAFAELGQAAIAVSSLKIVADQMSTPKKS